MITGHFLTPDHHRISVRYDPRGSPCHPEDQVGEGCAAGWPLVEAGARSQHLPLPLPPHSSAYPRRRIWRVCHCLGLHSSPSVNRTIAQYYWEGKLTEQRNMAHVSSRSFSGGGSLAWPLPQSHPEVWQRCHPSPSASPLLHSCERQHGSSCACVPASLHGRPLCRCSVASQGWSATCARYCLVSWVLENSENPSCARAAGLQMSQGGWHHCCTLIVCLERKRRRSLGEQCTQYK